jgi:hypothetical protein
MRFSERQALGGSGGKGPSTCPTECSRERVAICLSICRSVLVLGSVLFGRRLPPASSFVVGMRRGQRVIRGMFCLPEAGPPRSQPLCRPDTRQTLKRASSPDAAAPSAVAPLATVAGRQGERSPHSLRSKFEAFIVKWTEPPLLSDERAHQPALLPIAGASTHPCRPPMAQPVHAPILPVPPLILCSSRRHLERGGG